MKMFKRFVLPFLLFSGVALATLTTVQPEILKSMTAAQIIVANGSGIPTATTVSGDVTIGATGATAIGSGKITNAMVNSSAAIDYSKFATLNTGSIVAGNAGVPTATAVSGDITIGATGVTAIGANKVTDAMIRQSAGLSLIGRSASSTGNVADITASSDGQVCRRSGTAIGFGAVDLASANAVTGNLAVSHFNSGTNASASTVWRGDGTWAAAGGGGGGSLDWRADGADAPAESTEFGNKVYIFVDGLSQNLYAVVKVPQSYIAGNPIKVRFMGYHQAASATQLLLCQSTLIATGTAFDNTTNQRTSTNTAQTGASKVLVEHICDVTDTGGLVNGQAVAANNILRVRVYRSTDSSTSDVSMLPSTTEVTFQ